MDIKISMDKVVLEFESVPTSRYLGWSTRLEVKGMAKRVVYNKLYCYECHVELKNGAYMHVFFKNFAETEGFRHTFRIETNPEHFPQFIDLLEPIWEVTEQVYFVGGDVAFDVPRTLDNVFIIANDARRRIRLCEDTRYFGTRHQRKKNNYCRTYNKREQLLTRGIDLGYDLTRIEMVYKPSKRIRLDHVADHPPEFNKYYFAMVLIDTGILTDKERERVKQMQIGKEQYSLHVRKTIKKSLASQHKVDFNQLASECWADILKEHKLIR